MVWFVVVYVVAAFVVVAVVIAVADVAVVQVLSVVALVAVDVVPQVVVHVKGQALFDVGPPVLFAVVAVFAFAVVLDVAVVRAVSDGVALVVVLVHDVGLQVVVDVVALLSGVPLRFAFVAVAHHVDEQPLAVGVATDGPLPLFVVEPLLVWPLHVIFEIAL